MINCVYIHIPFCEKKCKYCSFCSFRALKAKDEYINALTKEIKFFYKNEKLKTIYLGGGTPSLLDTKDIKNILKNFNYSPETEITIEINPHNITKEKLKNYKSLGINRISVGIQSFDDEILKIIGRNHTTKEALEVIENIKKTDFNNFSIDLIYGLPNQDMSNWINTLNMAVKLNPDHISLYGLKIEKGSYFYKFLPKKLPDDEMQAKMYETAINKLKEKYIHYEFSNFAKDENYFSKHNCAYWECKNYYGFGLSASGYIENKRYTNTFNFKNYIKNPTEKIYEILSKENKIEEEIFLGLRLSKGIDFNKINYKYNINLYNLYKKEFDKFLALNLMTRTKNGVKLTQRGILLSNEILCEFIKI